jgi:transmembrane sensor
MQDIDKLLEKYTSGHIEKEELEILLKWFHEYEANVVEPLTEDDFKQAQSNFKIPFLSKDNDLQLSGVKSFWLKFSTIAAAVFVLFAFGIYFFRYSENDNTSEKNAFQDTTNMDAPLLIVEGGKTINLTNNNSFIDRNSGTNFKVISDERLEYKPNNSGDVNSNTTHFHTLKTPLKCVYQIQLEDGTKIHLNSLSSIRFPASFAGLGTREIELRGEAYFEVSANYLDKEKNIRKPFIVHTKNQIIEVLGTAFNISAYATDSHTTTTLVHGKVSVKDPHSLSKNRSVVLTNPGDQVLSEGDGFVKRNVVLHEEVAWRDGKLVFNDLDLYSIMRTIARWYPIEVEYRGNFKNDLFGGTITKDKKLEDVLKLLEATGEVKFKIEQVQGQSKERRVLVMK